MPATLPESAQRHRELLDELIEDVVSYSQEADLDLVTEAFAYACAHHDGQRRKSGEEFIYHPWGVAKICALPAPAVDGAGRGAAARRRRGHRRERRGDRATLFGEDVRRWSTASRSCRRSSSPPARSARPRTYRKMIMSMAQDIRVIVIKLADRLHNMRTLVLPAASRSRSRRRRRRSTSSRRWPTASASTPSSGELEDLAFATSTRASTPRSRPWSTSAAPTASASSPRPARSSAAICEKVGVEAQISGRAKHFYSIFVKMTRAQGRSSTRSTT